MLGFIHLTLVGSLMSHPPFPSKSNGEANKKGKNMKLMTIFIIISFFFGIFVGMIYMKNDSMKTEIITSEIHLVIPKNEKELRKQYLHVTVQKAMIEEEMKWNEKSKKEKEKKDGK